MTSCAHGWSEVSRRFTPALWGGRSINGSQDMVERALHGFTTYRTAVLSLLEGRIQSDPGGPTTA